jgi:predicted Zn-dependent protease with MMP-like domain
MRLSGAWAAVCGCDVAEVAVEDLESTLEAIDDALDADEVDEALRLAQRARKQFPAEPEVHLLLGDALLACAEMHEARRAYEEAARLAPESPDALASLAWAHYQLADFDAARTVAQRSIELHANALATSILGRLAERAAKLEDANRLAQRAHALDPETYPLPLRISEEDFREVVSEALDRLPEEFRRALDGEVAVLVEPVPSVEILKSEDPPWDPELLGLYVGVPLPKREVSIGGPKLPDIVYLFQRNLEHVAANREELVEQIAVTVYHEVGHYLGYDDDELEERGIG